MRRLNEHGQSTVEFVIVAATVAVIATALSALWNLFDAGVLVEHALSSASHHIKADALGSIGDVFLY